MILVVLRGIFLLLVATVITLYVNSDFQWQVGLGFGQVTMIIAVAVSVAAGVIAFDVYSKHKRLSAISGVFLGLLAGLLAAYALSFVVDLVGVYAAPEDDAARAAFMDLLRGVKVIIGLVTCYVAISLVIQTKDDFRFVIPYVEFAKEVRGSRPTLLDTSVIVDGRVLDVIDTHVMQGSLIIPKFVLDELQLIADSADKLKRARGRRGLEMLQKLQANGVIDVRIEDHVAEGHGVDQKLIDLAKQLKARVMTNDYNLNQIATLRGVEVININDLAKALRPVALPGEHMVVKLVKPGESPGQGIGYLDDGTMVVVENGRSHVGHAVELIVTSTLQTSAGRMIFGKFDHDEDPGNGGGGGGDTTPPAPTGPDQTQAAVKPSIPQPPDASASAKSRPRARATTSRRNPRRG